MRSLTIQYIMIVLHGDVVALPIQILNHGGDAAWSAIVIVAESCCASLDSFDLVDAGPCRWVPDCSRIL